MSSFWSPSFWLIGDITWTNLTSTPDLRLPQVADISFVPLLAILLIILRKIVEEFVGEPLGLTLGVPPRASKPKKNFQDNPTLEKLFHSIDRSNSVITALSSKTDLTERQIQSWLRKRQKFHDFDSKPQTIDKFKESAWRFCFYLFIFLYGCTILKEKPWFEQVINCWRGWPNQPLDDSIRWYYIFEGAFYVSLMVSQFSDVKRKDFYQMFLHHIVTLMLMFGSWSVNMVRVGSLVLCLHDAVDWILESCKMSSYSKYETLSTVMVCLFGLVWFVTRIVIFPLYIIKSAAFDSISIFEQEGIGDGDDMSIGGVFYLFIGCLSILFILHCIWFYRIIALAVKVMKGDENIRDTRSETSSMGEEDEE